MSAALRLGDAGESRASFPPSLQIHQIFSKDIFSGELIGELQYEHARSSNSPIHRRCISQQIDTKRLML